MPVHTWGHITIYMEINWWYSGVYHIGQRDHAVPFFKWMKNVNCVYDKYVYNTIVKPYILTYSKWVGLNLLIHQHGRR